MASFEELTFKLPDRYPAYARYWPAEPCRGGVLMLHGLRSHSGWYEASAGRLQELGYSVLQVDRRGAGRNRRARGHADWPFRLIRDVDSAARWLCDRVGQSRIDLMGISWGGRLAAAYYVKRPARVRRLYLVTPGLFPKVDIETRYKFLITAALVSYRRFRFDIPLNEAENFTSLPNQIRFIEDDPYGLLKSTAAFFLTSIMLSVTAKRLAVAPPVPVHLFLAGDDRIIDAARTAHFIRNLGWPEWSITTYENSRHTLELDVDRDAFLNDLCSKFDLRSSPKFSVQIDQPNVVMVEPQSELSA